MNFRVVNVLLGLVALALVGGWLLITYRVVPRAETASPSSPQAEKVDHGQAGVPAGLWRIAIKLSMPGLDIPAVQCAIFSDDPLERLKADRQRARGGDPAVMWDLLFRNVTGDEVYLLSASTNATAGLGSNQPGGKKWLVTKTARSGEKVYCWSVPFEANPEKDVSIQLSSTNALTVADIFKD